MSTENVHIHPSFSIVTMSVMQDKIAGYVLLLLGISMLLVSCGEPAGGMGKSPVFLIANGGDLVGTVIDVYDPAVPGRVVDDFFEVTVESIYKNQTDPPATRFADVIIQEYRVTYYRIDGNPNVPDPFVYQLTAVVPAAGSTTINVLIMKAEAKLKSPLKELVFGGGEGEINFEAIIEIFGEDLMGNAVSTSMVLIIQARDV